MNAIQIRRVHQAIILTVLTGILVVILDLALGAQVLGLVLVTLPVPLVLLWLSADVVRADELLEVSEREEDSTRGRPRRYSTI